MIKRLLLAVASISVVIAGCSESSRPSVTNESYVATPTTTDLIATSSIPDVSEHEISNLVQPVVVDTFCMATDLTDEFGNNVDSLENSKIRMLVWSNGTITAASFFDEILVGGYPNYQFDTIDGQYSIPGKWIIKCLDGYP